MHAIGGQRRAQSITGQAGLALAVEGELDLLLAIDAATLSDSKRLGHLLSPPGGWAPIL